MKYIKTYEYNKLQSSDNKELKIYRGDDWEGIYYKGKLLYQGHSINYTDVLFKLGYKLSSDNIEENDWENIGWALPNNLEELEYKLNVKKYNL